MIMNNPSAERVPAFAAARSGAAMSATDEPIPSGPGGPRPARTGGDDVIKTVRREEPKVGRNDPCPCGSGRKYKKCHGTAA
jgi:preprotein translocase subunit SecA